MSNETRRQYGFKWRQAIKIFRDRLKRGRETGSDAELRIAELVSRKMSSNITPSVRSYYYLGKSRGLTLLSTGQPFFINTSDRGITTWIILGGVWETFVDNVLTKLAKSNMNFRDVGANMGYYSIKVGGLIGPHGKILSFEPNPELFEYLRDNIDINGMSPRAQIWQLALGNKADVRELKFDYQNMGGGSLMELGERSRAVSVSIDTLEHLIPAGTRIDLMKIDAEGYEPLILEGAGTLLRENPNMLILLEVSIGNWRQYCEPKDVLEGLIGLEKEVFRIDTNGDVVPMGNASEFLKTIDENFVAYCLIAPRDARIRTELAEFIRLN